jgi:hypothetical protein
MIDGRSALGTGGGIPSGGVSKGGGDLPVDGDDMCLFGSNNRGVSILVMGNGNLSVDIGDSLSAAGGAALGSGGGLDQICGGGNPPGARRPGNRTISTCLLSSSPWRASMRPQAGSSWPTTSASRLCARVGLPSPLPARWTSWTPLCWSVMKTTTTTTSTVLGDARLGFLTSQWLIFQRREEMSWA